MMTFREFSLSILLDEDLSDVQLKRVDHGTDQYSQKWSLHHPVHGNLANLWVDSTDGKPLHSAKSASIDIMSLENAAVPQEDRKVVNLGTKRQTTKYNLGRRTVHRLFSHLKQHYPQLTQINQSKRVTGARQKNGSFKSAKLNFKPAASEIEVGW